MQIRKILSRTFRVSRSGIDAVSAVNVVASGNAGEEGAVTHASSSQSAAAGSERNSARSSPVERP
ncbi:MAG TPA: hypothetical protein VNT58_09970 [Gaiellaceae bacterium]|nr:hypothetical protein [Gaiellaceae bacterium]